MNRILELLLQILCRIKKNKKLHNIDIYDVTTDKYKWRNNSMVKVSFKNDK